MKKVLIGFGIVVLLAIIGVSTIWSSRNTAVALEERIEAQFASNKSNYDNMWKKFKELTQVTEIQAEQMKDVYKDLITGRYNDTKLLFKAVQENNPNLNTEVYAQLQREISAGRNTFDNNQKQIADIIREYNTYIKKKIIMSVITGRQPKDINKYIVTSEKTEKAFESGQDNETINLRDK